MRRLALVVVPAVLLLAVVGCSSSGPPTAAPTGRAGNPSDTASPNLTSPTATSTPPLPPESSAAQAADAASSAATAGLDLPACMIGTWTAPVAREFGHLGLAERSGGTVRGATGNLSVTFTPAKRWTFTYQQVTLRLAAGSADAGGALTGTWSLAGNTLTSTIGSNSVKATMTLGGVTVAAPGVVTNVLQTLPPDQVLVTCTGTGLQFQLPTSQGGGTATFDRA